MGRPCAGFCHGACHIGAGVRPSGLEQQIQRRAGGIKPGIAAAVDIAAPGVVEMGEIELVDLLVPHQLQQGREVLIIQVGEGIAQAGLDALRVQQADRVQRGVVGAVQAPELVMGVALAVDADADIIKLLRGYAGRHRRADQGPIGGQRGVKALGLRPRGDLENVWAQQGLTAGQNQHRHAVALQIIHRRADLGKAQLSGVVMVGGERVAMLAGEVAAPGQVPDHHRAAGAR